MSLVINMTDPEVISEWLNNTEVKLINGLYDVQEYKSGTEITQPEGYRSLNMSIVARGNIKVKIQSIVGESTIHMLKPGDMLEVSALAEISHFDTGTPSDIHPTLYAIGDTRVLNLDRVEVERKLNSQLEITYSDIHSMEHTWQDSLQSMQNQCAALRNYTYGINGRY